jgi:hypothetical protein
MTKIVQKKSYNVPLEESKFSNPIVTAKMSLFFYNGTRFKQKKTGALRIRQAARAQRAANLHCRLPLFVQNIPRSKCALEGIL